MKMLDPKSNRLDYGQILAPPSGYELDFAVCTTYSLDLKALTSACVALGLSGDTDSILTNNPESMLMAMQQTIDKIVLFCEGGHIHIPKVNNKLNPMLDSMVFTIAPDKKGSAYPSFHPKFWLIRYKSIKENKENKENEENKENKVNEEYLYRVIVLSRNLTFDRSWDVVFSMDGTVSKTPSDNGPKKKNEHIKDFLEYLKEKLDNNVAKNKAEKIGELIKELDNVCFTLEKGSEFTDFEFIPVGINNDYKNIDDAFNSMFLEDGYNDVVIMSPFLSAEVIEKFKKAKGAWKKNKFVLITRETELPKLKPVEKFSKLFDVYVMKKIIVDGEDSLSDDNTDILKQDVHAKIYMTRKGNEKYLYFGSLNASRNAFFCNIEFMMRLKTEKLTLKKLRDSLGIGKDDGPFKFVDLESIKNKQEDLQQILTNDLNKLIKAIDRSNLSAEVIKEENGKYKVTITFKEADSGECKKNITDISISIKPMSSEVYKDLANNDEFADLELEQPSKFYSIKVSGSEEQGEQKTEQTIISISIKPSMLSERYKDLANNVDFADLELEQLSEFYSIRVFGFKEQGEQKIEQTIERIIKIPTNIPENRNEAIISSVFKDGKSLLHYFDLILNSDLATRLESAIEREFADRENGVGSGIRTARFSALYENLLYNAAKNPEKIKEIKAVVDSLDAKNKNFEGFDLEKLKKMMEIFEEAVSEND